tara:strand:- start:189 stop:308 length:120 start_codon:yes stop_codon:yes gene_type:complete
MTKQIIPKINKGIEKYFNGKKKFSNKDKKIIVKIPKKIS